jgi:gliding motility-associated-like protein
MKENMNIDDLLKQELGNLNQVPPASAWQNIASKIPATQAAVQTASVTKSVAGLSLKYLAIALATIAVSAAAYVYILSSPVTQTALPNTPTPSSLLSIQPNTNKAEETVIALDENKSLPAKQLTNSKIGSGKECASCPGLPNKNDVAIDYPDPTVYAPTEQIKQEEQTNHTSNTVAADELEKNQPEEKNKPNIAATATPASEEFLKPNIPNVFTPNGDGYNDEFVITIEDEQLFELKILDAKGQIVFECKDKNQHWPGIKQNSGIACEPGLYVFALRYQTQSMKTPKVEQGFILLKQ